MKTNIIIKHRDMWVLGLIMMTAFLIYFNAIKGDFVVEDLDIIVNNQFVKDWKNLPLIFTKGVGAGLEPKYGYYRPMHIFSYLLEYTLWGLDVRGYHIVNIFLHGLVGFLIYRLILILFLPLSSPSTNRSQGPWDWRALPGSPQQDLGRERTFLRGREGERGNSPQFRLALVTALLFVVHPIHDSVVAHIAGRENILGAFFLLISFIIYIIAGRQNNLYYAPLLLATWSAALLSKENNIMFPFLLGVYHYTFKERVRPVLVAVVLGIWGMYFNVRALMIECIPFKAVDLSSALARIPGAFVALTKYFHILISPTWINQLHYNMVFPVVHPLAVSGYVLFAGIAGYACYKRRADVCLFFAAAWFGIMYLPVSNLYPLGAYMSEHWIYLASLGYFLFAARVICAFYNNHRMKTASAAVFICLIIAGGWITHISNRYWFSHAVLTEENYRADPDNPLTLNAYGCLQYRRREYQQAISCLVKAIIIKPDYADAYINLGAVLRAIGDYQRAAGVLNKAIKIAPSKAAAFHNLGTIEFDSGRYEQAQRLFLKAVELNPNGKEAYFNLAIIALKSGDLEKASGWYRKGLELDPGNTRARQKLCNVYRQTHQPDMLDEYCK